jgi:TatA/E family protein of Tat protein translocase
MGLGTGEIILIVFVVVLVFGASRLPKLGSELGRAVGGLKRALGGAKEIEDSVKTTDVDGAARPKREEPAPPADKT